MKKIIGFIGFIALSLSSCTSDWDKANGQVIYHWERENTGVQKFARDHSECMRVAENWRLIPNIKNWIITEEVQYDIVADWHSKKGIWASYIPYPGAQPLVVNSIRDDSDSSPKKYRMCMENKGYWHRRYDIPETTNLFVYKPQGPNQDDPLKNFYYKGTRP